MHFFYRLLALTVVLIPFSEVSATELTHSFQNPSFGGHPLNGAYLLNRADQQNKFKDPDGIRSNLRRPQSDLQRFTNRLQQAILNRVSQNAVSGLFDENGNILENADLNIDIDGDGNPDFIVTVQKVDDNNLKIFIESDGTTTTLTVPYIPNAL